MSSRNWKTRVTDILDAAMEIQEFVSEMDFTAFEHDIKTIRAVELNFIIIGEAVNGIPDEVQDDHPEIPWHFMRAMRNRLVHVYFQVDPKLVWDTIRNDLPVLIQSLSNLT
jgi:uncharacterized protein with HEPN domain